MHSSDTALGIVANGADMRHRACYAVLMTGEAKKVAIEPMPTLSRVLALAVPIMLANASTPLIGFVDAAVIGRLGDAALIGGVALGAAIFNAIYWCVGFLRMSTTGFAAQALGARDGVEIAATLVRALLIAIAIGVAVIVLQVPIRHGFLWVLGGSPAVQAATTAYYDWRIWAAPAGLVNFALFGWFIGLGRTMVAFWLQVLANLLNIGFALLFVPILGWGVPGVGLAAFLAEWAAAIGGLVIAAREFQARGARLNRMAVLQPAKLRAMFAANRDIMIRTVCVLAASQIFLRLSAGQGDAALAANALLLTLLTITYFMLDGYAHATETLVGQAVGAKDRLRLDRSVQLAAIAAGMTGVIAGIVIWASSDAIIAFMTTNADVRALTSNYMVWVALLPFMGVWCFLLDGVFIGATRTADMRDMMLLSFGVYLAALGVFVPAFGNHGIWAAHSVFFIARAITLAWKYPALARAAEAPRDA
jgi:multidrug resistance protein, MATE family